MPTQCIPEQLEFQGLGKRKIVTDFSGGRMTSDAGGLLLREVEKGTGILRAFADCFVDLRAQELVEHSVLELVSQRVYAIALGYEDINDHDELRRDALLATLVGKTDPAGADRARDRDRGFPLAGKSTLNRLELAPADTKLTHRYHKIVCRPDAVDRFFVDAFLDAYPAWVPPLAFIAESGCRERSVKSGGRGCRFARGMTGHRVACEARA